MPVGKHRSCGWTQSKRDLCLISASTQPELIPAAAAAGSYYKGRPPIVMRKIWSIPRSQARMPELKGSFLAQLRGHCSAEDRPPHTSLRLFK